MTPARSALLTSSPLVSLLLRSLPLVRALQQPGRGQAFLDVLDGVAVGRAERGAAGAPVEALEVHRRLEPADAEAARDPAVGEHHARGHRLGLLPPPLAREVVHLAELARRDGG